MNYVTNPKKIPQTVAQHIARCVRLVADCSVTQAAACDEAARLLIQAGNTHEAFAFETAAEQFRAAARQNYRMSFALGVSK